MCLSGPVAQWVWCWPQTGYRLSADCWSWTGRWIGRDPSPQASPWQPRSACSLCHHTIGRRPPFWGKEHLHVWWEQSWRHVKSRQQPGRSRSFLILLFVETWSIYKFDFTYVYIICQSMWCHTFLNYNTIIILEGGPCYRDYDVIMSWESAKLTGRRRASGWGRGPGTPASGPSGSSGETAPRHLGDVGCSTAWTWWTRPLVSVTGGQTCYRWSRFFYLRNCACIEISGCQGYESRDKIWAKQNDLEMFFTSTLSFQCELFYLPRAKRLL